MPDAVIKVRAGEKRPVYGRASAQTGTTLQIGGSPTVSLYNSAGDVVLSNVACTDFDTGPLLAPRVWYNLDTLTPALLTPGFYSMVFKFAAAGSDNIGRVYEPVAEIQVGDPRTD